MSNYFLTTPIYYVTAKPHLGHAYTTIVGDAIARWHRLLGENVHFLTGTDEHGQKVQQAAEAAGQSPQDFTDSIAPLYQQAWQQLNISNDDFIRTTEQRHKIGVAELLQRCYDAGDIELDLYKGKYCIACEEYYTDDELDPGDLCRIHHLPVENVEEENYFFRLSRFQDRLLDWYAAHPGAIVPEFRGNEALGLIRGGLRDFSVSRTSITWGIPLPWDDKHVAYVWFDALANYLTAVGYGSDPDRFAEWWPAHHLIGKDIVRHHCVYWPAMLISAGIEPPAGWAVGGWLLVGGEKMSKTTGNVVNPLDLVADVGLDGFRYYILADTPYGNDGDFTYEGLIGRYNSDLANNLGNLLARVATVVDQEVRRRRSGAASRFTLGRRGRVGVRGHRRGVGRVRTQPRPRRDVEPDPRHQLPPRGQRAVEGRAWRGGRCHDGRCPRGIAHRRHARPRLQFPKHPRQCGSGSASAAGSTTNASRQRPNGAAIPVASR